MLQKRRVKEPDNEDMRLELLQLHHTHAKLVEPLFYITSKHFQFREELRADTKKSLGYSLYRKESALQALEDVMKKEAGSELVFVFESKTSAIEEVTEWIVGDDLEELKKALSSQEESYFRFSALVIVVRSKDGQLRIYGQRGINTDLNVHELPYSRVQDFLQFNLWFNRKLNDIINILELSIHEKGTITIQEIRDAVGYMEYGLG